MKTTEEDKDLQIDISDTVEDQMSNDPELAEAMRVFMAVMRQAHDAVQRGQHKTMEDAIEALTGSRPVKLDPDTGEKIHGSMDEDMEKFAMKIEVVEKLKKN